MIAGKRRHTPTKQTCDEQELVECVRLRVSQGWSWDDWEAHRQANKLPVWRKMLQALQVRILSSVPVSVPFKTEAGAYIDVLKVFQQIAMQYQQNRLFYLATALQRPVCMWKISFDNRYIFRKKNEGFFLQPLSVLEPQAVAHVTSIAVARIKEETLSLRSVLVEMRLADALKQLEHMQVLINDQVICCDYLITGDWISIHRELATDVPNSRDADALTCWGCWVTKAQLKASWWQEPFKYTKPCRTIDDFADTALPTVPLYKRRYCWMHGVTRLLSTTLSHLYECLPRQGGSRSEFKEIVSSVHPDWDVSL